MKTERDSFIGTLIKARIILKDDIASWKSYELLGEEDKKDFQKRYKRFINYFDSAAAGCGHKLLGDEIFHHS